MTRYIKSFQNANAIQEAVNNEELLKPYVAYNETTATIDYNTKKSIKETPLTFEIISGGTIVWKAKSSGYTVTLEYSKNGGEWTEITSNTDTSAPTITVEPGDTVQFRGNNTTLATTDSKYNTFSGTTCTANLSGNIMSLLKKDNFSTAYTLQSAYTFIYLFSDCRIKDVSKLVLPATTLADNCYLGLLGRCTLLTTAPVLPATTLAEGCYQYMFYGCTSLTTVPELPATTLTKYCYQQMFRNCSSLNYIKCLATDISAINCTSNWLNGVASTGTFIKTAGVNWSSGASGIPTGWTVEEI